MPNDAKPNRTTARPLAPLPIAAPERRKQPPAAPGAPDLRIEEIEERHIPKDRNIFDK